MHTITHVNSVCIYVTIYTYTFTLFVYILKCIHTHKYSACIYINIHTDMCETQCADT